MKRKNCSDKKIKSVLTAVSSLFTTALIVVGMGGCVMEDYEDQGETVQFVEEETTAYFYVESTMMTEEVESTTGESITESTTEESTTRRETTTAKPTTTKPTTTKIVTTTAKPTTTKIVTTTEKQTTTQKVTQNPDDLIRIYYTETGEKYHYENPCGNGTYYETSLSVAKARGLEPCGKCVLK